MVNLKLHIQYNLKPYEEEKVKTLLQYENKKATPQNIKKTLEGLLADTLEATSEDKYVKVLLCKAIEDKYNRETI